MKSRIRKNVDIDICVTVFTITLHISLDTALDMQFVGQVYDAINLFCY